jgi:hypothetical protein
MEFDSLRFTVGNKNMAEERNCKVESTPVPLTTGQYDDVE